MSIDHHKEKIGRKKERGTDNILVYYKERSP
jgi:hypothetical protein